MSLQILVFSQAEFASDLIPLDDFLNQKLCCLSITVVSREANAGKQDARHVRSQSSTSGWSWIQVSLAFFISCDLVYKNVHKFVS